VAGIIGIMCLDGCAPTINIATPQPLKADIAVRLDVYEKTSPTKAKDEQSSLEIAANRRLRSGEIQQLKNDGVVGEDRDGYLVFIRTPEDAKYLEYAKAIVKPPRTRIGPFFTWPAPRPKINLWNWWSATMLSYGMIVPFRESGYRKKTEIGFENKI
jgi:hypothetical protein